MPMKKPNKAKFSLNSSKNGGESGALLVSRADYASVQQALAESVLKDIGTSSPKEQIEEIVIRWKTPIEREYCYKIGPSV